MATAFLESYAVYLNILCSHTDQSSESLTGAIKAGRIGVVQTYAPSLYAMFVVYGSIGET
jgi:hypothetical protein